MGVMKQITLIYIVLRCFDISLFAVIKRSIISFKILFSSQEIRIMALVELRWQEGLGVGSFSVFICLTISIYQLQFKNPEKFCWLDQKSGQMSQKFSVL